MNARTMSLRGRSKGRQAANSSAMDAAARWGFLARGVIYLLIGLLALQIAFKGGGKQADRGGALAEIGEKPMGSFVLWALGIGLVGMCLWRLSEALFGASGPDGHKAGKRLLSAGRCLFYGFVAYSVLSFAAGDKGGSSGDQQSQDITAKALELPAASGSSAPAVSASWPPACGSGYAPRSGRTASISSSGRCPPGRSGTPM